MNPELTRHIVLPYSFNYRVVGGKIAVLNVDIPAFSITPSKQYKFKNFRLEVQTQNIFTATSIFRFTPPTFFLKGIISNEGISEYFNIFNTYTSYTYKSILNNPDFSADNLEISLTSQTNRLTFAGNTSGFNDGLGVNANVSNFIDAKQPVYNAFTSNSTNFNFFRYNDEFHFNNYNFKSIYICYSLPSKPIDTSKNFVSDLDYTLDGFVSFDIEQYSL